MLLKCCTHYASKFVKLSNGQGLEKASFHSNTKEGNAKECSHYCTIALISHVSKIMIKILQAMLSAVHESRASDLQVGFRKVRGNRDQTTNIHWIIEKARKFQKNIYFCFIDYAKAFDSGSQQTGKFLKKQEYHTTTPTSWETSVQVKKQQL